MTAHPDRREGALPEDLQVWAAQVGARLLAEKGFTLIASPSGLAPSDDCGSFTDAGDAPLTWLDTALQRSPATLSKCGSTSDTGGSLDDVKPRSEGKATRNG